MIEQQDFRRLGCAECTRGSALGFDFSMAFQPIVNTQEGVVFSYEALARGINNEPVSTIFARVNDSNRYRFDQTCRVKAVQLASSLAVPCVLNINFMPNAVYRPELCIRTTLDAAKQFNFPPERIMFEITEGEQIPDLGHVKEIVSYYKKTGFLTALDDFGAGYSGLNLLADLQTDFIKLDMALIRNIHQERKRQVIVRGIVQVCQELAIRVIAEGVETYEEWRALSDLGIPYFQGYYFSRPAFEAAETPDLSALLTPPTP